MQLADLKAYDVGRLKPGSRYARRYPEQQAADGERIPTLHEVIRLHKKQCNPASQLWVEIKTTPEKPGLTPTPVAVSGIQSQLPEIIMYGQLNTFEAPSNVPIPNFLIQVSHARVRFGFISSEYRPRLPFFIWLPYVFDVKYRQQEALFIS